MGRRDATTHPVDIPKKHQKLLDVNLKLFSPENKALTVTSLIFHNRRIFSFYNVTPQ